MKRIIFTLAIWQLFFSFACAQINVSKDADCGHWNSAIFSQALMDYWGVDSIKKLIDREAVIHLVCKVDSLGYVLCIDSIVAPSTILHPEKEFKVVSKAKLEQNKLERFLIDRKICFFTCYDITWASLSSMAEIRRHAREYFNEHGYFPRHVVFPSPIFYRKYHFEFDEHPQNAPSKYKYFLQQLKYNAPQKLDH